MNRYYLTKSLIIILGGLATTLSQSGCALLKLQWDDEAENRTLASERPAVPESIAEDEEIPSYLAEKAPRLDTKKWNDPEALAEYQAQQKERFHQAVSYQDLLPGMTMDDVQEAWGTPRSVESAGNPNSGNQRWVYHRGISSNVNVGATRVIYFERGRVVGWESSP